jgi:hypothetical protein
VKDEKRDIREGKDFKEVKKNAECHAVSAW